LGLGYGIPICEWTNDKGTRIWLSAQLKDPAVEFHDRAQGRWRGLGVGIVTFDEADTDNTNGGGKIYTVFAGQNVKMGFQSSTFYQSENLLKTINGFLGLANQGDCSKRECDYRRIQNERLIAKAAGLDDADAAIAYAVERDWLIAAGNPPHSICLTDDGRVMAARVLSSLREQLADELAALD
jgi:hypothetical protein